MKSLKELAVGAAVTTAPPAEGPSLVESQTTDSSEVLINHSSPRVGERLLSRPDRVCYFLLFAILTLAAFFTEGK